MVKEFQYTTTKEVLSRTLRHPLLQDISLEDSIQYILDFIGLFGLTPLYTKKEITIPIKMYNALLPCDLVSINQVKDLHTMQCLHSMTDTFSPTFKARNTAFKVAGRVIYTTFKEGKILVNYNAIPVDEEGFPMLPDNAVIMKCIEAYIKKEVFTLLYDTGKIQASVLDRAEQNYYTLAKALIAELNIPSISEMESISRLTSSPIIRQDVFDEGFASLGDRENIRTF